MTHAEEIMEILEAFDLTRSYRSAADLAGCDLLLGRKPTSATRRNCGLGPTGRAMYTCPMSKKKRPFVVEIEAKLVVHAFDEESARKKVEKAFSTGRPLGVDVDAGASVWTYAVVPPAEVSEA